MINWMRGLSDTQQGLLVTSMLALIAVGVVLLIKLVT